MALGVVLTSCYLFPCELVYLPGLNFKMLMAGLSIPLLLINLAETSNSLIDKDILIVALFTLPITVFSLLTTVINGTSDDSFTYYFVSVFVWMGAGYFLVNVLKAIHGEISMKLMIQYLIAVCCLQCVLALMMEYFPSFQASIDGIIGGSEMFMKDGGGRMHGIGCALDVAGGRFAAVLVMISVLMVKSSTRLEICLYLLAFSLITVIGNMIARTTTVGVALAICYLLIRTFFISPNLGSGRKSWIIFGVCFVLTSVLIFILYDFSPVFKAYFRFAFEGFFSLAETVQWEVSSNDK